MAWRSLRVTCATCCESWGRYDVPDLHSPPGRDAVGLLAGDRLPHGADYPLPVRQTPRPAAGLKAKFYSSACSSPKTYQKPAACGFSFVWWLADLNGLHDTQGVSRGAGIGSALALRHGPHDKRLMPWKITGRAMVDKESKKSSLERSARVREGF